MSAGPSISADVLVPVILLLVAAILVNLGILFRQPVPTGAKREGVAVAAGRR